MKFMKEKNNFTRWLIYAIFTILLIVTIWDIYAKIYSNIVLNILWALVLLILIFLSKKSKIPFLIYFFLSLLIALAVLGEFYLYNRIFFFDKIIHFFSQLVICPLILYLTKDKIKNKILLILFCVAVAVTLSVIWEITEYSLDKFVDGKLQGVYSQNNSLLRLSEENSILVQSEIDDTMTDLIFNILGSLVFAGIYLFKEGKRKDKKK